MPVHLKNGDLKNLYVTRVRILARGVVLKFGDGSSDREKKVLRCLKRLILGKSFHCLADGRGFYDKLRKNYSCPHYDSQR